MPPARRRLACRLQLYRSLLHAMVSGADVRTAMPSSALNRRPAPGAFPDDSMGAMYREAIRHAGDYRPAKEAERARAARTLETLDSPQLKDTLDLCPVEEPGENDDPAVAWLQRYESLATELDTGK